MVCGDSQQTLRVLVAYYRQKTKSLASASKDTSSLTSTSKEIIVNQNDMRVHRLSIFDQTNIGVKMELSEANTCLFVNYVDTVYFCAMMNHYQSWYDYSTPLILNSRIEYLMEEFERTFPNTVLVLSKTANTDR